MYNTNYYQPNQFQQPTYQRPVSGLKGRPVASLDEVRASAIDFDGTVFYFPDLANKRIYTKHINTDGTATLLMYELKETPVDTQISFVTRDEFEKVITEIQNLLVTTQSGSPEKEKIEYKF